DLILQLSKSSIYSTKPFRCQRQASPEDDSGRILQEEARLVALLVSDQHVVLVSPSLSEVYGVLD
ncbi:hypothetical protein ACTGJY_005199, partial [Klebsiella pneumoniae]